MLLLVILPIVHLLRYPFAFIVIIVFIVCIVLDIVVIGIVVIVASAVDESYTLFTL